MKAVWIVSM